jgi:hypothetical protein
MPKKETIEEIGKSTERASRKVRAGMFGIAA